MGYFGKLEEKLLAQKLRKKGWSYGKIMTRVHVSKDTMSRWCKDIELTTKQKEQLLKNKQFGQHKGSIIAAQNKQNSRIERTKYIYKQAKETLGKVSSRDRFIAGLALYAGEGDKTDGKGGFANADPNLIKFMTGWFIDYAKVQPEKLRGALWLHEGLNELEAKNFWSRLTNIPLGHFYKTYIARVKTNSRKIRKNIHPYGVFAINFCETDKQRQIIGWIKAAFGDKMQLEK